MDVWGLTNPPSLSYVCVAGGQFQQSALILYLWVDINYFGVLSSPISFFHFPSQHLVGGELELLGIHYLLLHHLSSASFPLKAEIAAEYAEETKGTYEQFMLSAIELEE